MPETEVWRALYAAATLHRFAGKWVIAIDEDIDPDNADALFWAMSYRCQPQHDMKVLERKDPGHGPRGPKRQWRERLRAHQCPAQERLIRRSRCRRRSSWSSAKAIWDRLGLPALKPESPWHGYDLGIWPPELQRQAEMAARSEYFDFSDELIAGRRSDVMMNDPIEHKTNS